MFLRRSRVATLRGPGSRAAFSLVELLVVIAILVILASFLMPGLSRAKETARRIHCVNNLRQLAIAWEAYAADNEERLAPNGYGTAESLQGRRLWVVGATHTVPQAFTNVDYLINSKYAAFADYLPNREVYKCPSDRSTVALGDKAYPKRSMAT
jgi:prepilin-type N-terminal cleavage/methylation domain-containing protein